MQTLNKEVIVQGLTHEAKVLTGKLSHLLADIKDKAQDSVVVAWRLGEICIKAKETVGHGNYEAWLESVNLSKTTAFRYVQLRTKYSTLELLDSANAQREGILALIVPNKERPEHEGDVKFTASPTHLAIVNDWHRFLRQVEIGKSTLNKEEIRKDLKPVYDWLKPIFES